MLVRCKTGTVQREAVHRQRLHPNGHPAHTHHHARRETHVHLRAVPRRRVCPRNTRRGPDRRVGPSRRDRTRRRRLIARRWALHCGARPAPVLCPLLPAELVDGARGSAAAQYDGWACELLCG